MTVEMLNNESLESNQINQSLTDQNIDSSDPIVSMLPSDYCPAEDEEFMNPFQREYFRRKLLAWKQELLTGSSETIHDLQEDPMQRPDISDRAAVETNLGIELRARDRERKLINKIDIALGKINRGTYGYCEESKEKISLKRLEARPIATLSLEAQERHERKEKILRDD